MQMQSLGDPTDCNPERWAGRTLVKYHTNQQIGQSAGVQTAAKVAHSLVTINADAKPQGLNGLRP